MKKYLYSIFMGVMMALLVVGCHQTQSSDQKAVNGSDATQSTSLPSPPPQADASAVYSPPPSPVAARESSTLYARVPSMTVPPIQPYAMPETAEYKNYSDNPIKQVMQEPLTTFSLD
ncbi:MAG: hypothetical protein ACRCWR_12225, partial [Saezia sp.]